MKLDLKKEIKFTDYYKKFNIVSITLIILSILIIVFKGLNLGVDFKGGTLIELRAENTNIKIAEIRQSFSKMNLGDVTVKNFGDENDYLITIEKNDFKNTDFIKDINNRLSSDMGYKVNFRRDMLMI